MHFADGVLMDAALCFLYRIHPILPLIYGLIFLFGFGFSGRLHRRQEEKIFNSADMAGCQGWRFFCKIGNFYVFFIFIDLVVLCYWSIIL